MPQHTKNNTPPKIQFENLYMHRSSVTGEVSGSLKIKSNDNSKVEITLPSEAIETVVDLVADQLAEAASIQSDRLREAILSRKS